MSTRPVLAVLSGGPLATIQDLGRPGSQHLGVPAGGAVDPVALRLANALAGNPPGTAGIEITLGGFEAQFLCDVAGGVAGADLGFTLDGTPLAAGVPFRAERGSRVRAAGRRRGCRAYLCLAGGFSVPRVLASCSTYAPARLGGFHGRALRAGDVLEGPGRTPSSIAPGRSVPPDLMPPYAAPGEIVTLRALPGPQDEAFSAAGLRTFFGETYEVSAEADRMGCRLRGPRVEHRVGADIISDGIAWGSVQVPGSGQPIVLLADRQTTGGYAKIATVITADLPLIAQAVPGDRIRFQEIDLCDARVASGLAEYRLRRWEKRPAGERAQPGANGGIR